MEAGAQLGVVEAPRVREGIGAVLPTGQRHAQGSGGGRLQATSQADGAVSPTRIQGPGVAPRGGGDAPPGHSKAVIQGRQGFGERARHRGHAQPRGRREAPPPGAASRGGHPGGVAMVRDKVPARDQGSSGLWREGRQAGPRHTGTLVPVPGRPPGGGEIRRGHAQDQL